MTSPGHERPAIRTEGLRREFGELVAVDGLDLRVEAGEFFSLLGPNGSGKTTTIRMLCCLLRPTVGTAEILGHDVVDDPMAVKQVIAVSPQETAVARHLTGRENLRMMAGLHGFGKRGATDRADELLGLMGLADRADDRAKQYSGGMERRLSVAMALVSDPQVLFLDEPTIGLDPQARRSMWGHLAELKGSTTVVLTTHYLEEADALADRIAVVDAGRLIALGTAAELKSGISGTPVTVVEVPDLPSAGLEALRARWPDVRVVEGGVEIAAADVGLYELSDCLRPLGVEIRSTYRKQVTLDDVFLELTGEELRS